MSNPNKKVRGKLTYAFLSISTALWITGAVALVPTMAGAATTAEIIAQLQAQIAALQAQLTSLQGTTAAGYAFSVNLKQGDRGTDVTNLQTVLKMDPTVYPEGLVTGYFGPATKRAVAKFQAKYAADTLTPVGLTQGSGFVGALTRAKLNALYGGAVAAPAATTPAATTPAATTPAATTPAATTPAATTGAVTLTVAAADTQPTATLFPINATRAPFTKVKLTASGGDIRVNSLTVERTGLANDAAFSGIILLDENGAQLGIAKTLNSVHQATLTEPFTVKNGESKVMTIAGNAQTSGGGYGGQIAYLSLVSINTAATVTGSLPITGAGYTINETLSIGTVSMSRGALDPGASQTKEVGTTGYTFSSIKVTAGSAEKVYLKSIRWYQSGSAASGDLANLKTYVDGTAYDVTLSSDGKYYTSTFPENSGKGLLIDKGFFKEISIKGDIIGGSARTIDFDVAKRTDLSVVGENYGYGINPPLGTGTTDDAAAFRTTDDPWYDAAQVTVSSGTVTVSTSNAVASQNVAINLSGQPLGAFSTNVQGEAVSVAAIAFNVTIGNLTASKSVADVTNVAMYDENGNVVAGPVDGVSTEVNTNGATGASHGEIRFSDTVTFPIGQHTYTLKAKYGTNFANNDTVTASTTPRNWGTARGLVTGNTISINPNSAITLSQMTIKSASLAVSVSSIPIAQTVIANTNQWEFARYVFDSTASGEDIRVTSIPLEYNVAVGTATNLTNCQLYDGATSITTGSNIKNPSTTSSSTSFTFNGTGLTVPKGTAKTLSLKCDIVGGATGTYYWGLDGTQDTSYSGATGIVSGQSATNSTSFTGSIGQAMSASAGGNLAVLLDTNSPSYNIVNAGATGVELARIRFIASNEPIDLQRVTLQLSQVASNTPEDLVGRKVTLWDGVTYVGEAGFPTGDNATSSVIVSGTFRIPRNGGKVLTVKGDIAAISSGGPLLRSGDLLIVDFDGDNNGTNTGTYGTGVSSGSRIAPAAGTADTTSSGVRIMQAYPTLSYIDLSSSQKVLPAGTTPDQKLYRFSVTANNGDIALYKFNFAVGSSTLMATTSLYSLYAYTNSGFSNLDTTFISTGLINAGQCFSGLVSTGAGPKTVSIYPDKTGCNKGTTTYIVPGNTATPTRYFELRGTVANVTALTTSLDSITVKLNGDSAFPVNSPNLMQIASGVDGDTNNNFIWSPISTTSQNLITDLDFTNGYQLVGLPAVGMSTVSLQSH